MANLSSCLFFIELFLCHFFSSLSSRLKDFLRVKTLPKKKVKNKNKYFCDFSVYSVIIKYLFLLHEI